MRLVLSSLCALALVLVACHSHDPAPSDGRVSPTGAASMQQKGARASSASFSPAAGSRLVPRLWKGEDGALLAAGWFDTKIGEDCSPALGPDGAMRCMPAAMTADVFADDRCTKPAAIVPACGKHPRFFRVGDPACGKYDIVDAASKVEPAPAEVYAFAGKACMARLLQPGEEVYVAGSSTFLKSETFVGLSEFPLPAPEEAK